MPFVLHTPESLLPRSDSKNPATTCNGITSTGRPCRRPLTKQAPLTTASSQLSLDALGVQELLFCWQHKDQAVAHARPPAQHGSHGVNNVPRRQSSLDTMIGRLGLHQHSTRSHGQSNRNRGTRESSYQRKAKPRQNPSMLSLLCCLGSMNVSEDEKPPRIRSYADVRSDRPTSAGVGHARPQGSYGNHQNTDPRQASAALETATPQARTSVPISRRPPLRPTGGQLESRPTLRSGPSSRTESLLSFIPRHLSPQTTSQLLAELAKAFSGTDEAGYIYMFWLRESASGQGPIIPSALSALADDSPTGTPDRPRRNSDARNQGSLDNPALRGTLDRTKKILLKIGRASNVQRRMNEWTSQCGYDLSVVRYYPHVSSETLSGLPLVPSPRLSRSPGTPASTLSPRKVPHVNRVERLIHIELADMRLKSICQSCGREHREWFAVDATRDAVKAVDHAIKRWVNWGEMVT